MVYYLPNRSMAQTADGPGGERKAEENPLQWTRSFAIMLAAATVIAIALNFLSLYYREKKDEVLTEEPASKVKAATLTVSDDRTSCKFSAIKPVGKIELTVSCYGTETVIPVYLWNR